VRRKALATTNSDGGIPGRMVLSQDPNEAQTSFGSNDGEILEQTLGDDACLNEDVIGAHLALTNRSVV
jgi:hypothetical protein